MTRNLNTHETLQRDEAVQGSSDRSFGLVFTGFFTLLGLLPLLHRRPIRIWALLLAVVFLSLAWLRPVWLRPLNLVWRKLGLLLHAITNPLILGVLFYLVFTPFAFFLRLMRKDYLRLRPDRASPTYWLPRDPPGPAAESMANQF